MSVTNKPGRGDAVRAIVSLFCALAVLGLLIEPRPVDLRVFRIGLFSAVLAICIVTAHNKAVVLASMVLIMLSRLVITFVLHGGRLP